MATGKHFRTDPPRHAGKRAAPRHTADPAFPAESDLAAPPRPRRRWWPAVVALVAAVAILAGGLWLWRVRPATPDTRPTDTDPVVTTPSTAPTGEDTAETPLDTPAEPRVLQKPDTLRAATLTAGVDYASQGQSTADARAQIDAALTQLVDWNWNTVLVTLSPNDTDSDGLVQYILDKAKEKSLFVYLILDFGVSAETGPDPAVSADRARLTDWAESVAKTYPCDGFWLTDYSYRYGDDRKTDGAPDTLIREAVQRILAVNRNAYTGLLTEAVWAHRSVQAEGSATSGVYEEYTDGGADTRQLVLDGTVDFVAVRNYGAVGSYSAGFETVAAWWASLCEQANLPLYMYHAATKAVEKPKGWQQEDQLARQVLACQPLAACAGNAVDSLAALLSAPSATEAMQRAFDGTLMEEYITRTLTLTAPNAARITTEESAYNLRGSADPNFPLTVNGEAVTLTDHGYFSLDVSLQPGENTFTFTHKGVTETYVIYRNRLLLKSVAPSSAVTLDGSSKLSVSAVALKGAVVTVRFNGKTVSMTETEQQAEESGGEVLSDYVIYAAELTMPAGVTGREQVLGELSVSASYDGQTDTKTGGAVTVRALAADTGTVIKPVDSQVQPIDPSKGATVLKEGTLLAITADYAETFDGDTTDDYSRPTNAYLPQGTTDILAGTAYDTVSGNYYYLLGCGRRVYQTDATVYMTGGKLTANTLKVRGCTATDKATTLTLQADWHIPYQLQLLPQKYGNPTRQDYTISAQTTEYIEITFYYTAATEGVVDVSASPLFRSAEWVSGAENTRVLRLYLTAKAQFYGYGVTRGSDGTLTFTFKHPTYVGDNSAELPLAGFKVVIDPGHGGNSIGTASGKTPEKAVALTYALKLREKLEALGATVIMTRTDDSALSLLERTQITRASGADLFISVHMNGSTSASAHGCSVHYFSDYSRDLAAGVYERMQETYTAYGADKRGGFPWSPFYVCRVSEMPSLLLECGYMTNAADMERLIRPDFQDALMASVAKAVVEYAQTLPKL